MSVGGILGGRAPQVVLELDSAENGGSADNVKINLNNIEPKVTAKLGRAPKETASCREPTTSQSLKFADIDAAVLEDAKKKWDKVARSGDKGGVLQNFKDQWKANVWLMSCCSVAGAAMGGLALTAASASVFSVPGLIIGAGVGSVLLAGAVAKALDSVIGSAPDNAARAIRGH